MNNLPKYPQDQVFTTLRDVNGEEYGSASLLINGTIRLMIKKTMPANYQYVLSFIY